MKDSSRMNISTSSYIRFFLVLAGVFVLYQVRDIILMILTAIVIASAVEPVTQWFEKRGIPRIVSVLGIYASLTIVIIGFFYLLLPPLVQQSSDLLQNLPSYIKQIDTTTSSSSLWSIIPKQSFSFDSVFNNIGNPVSSSASVLHFVGSLFGGIASALIVFVLSLYLSAIKDGVSFFLKVITPPPHVDYVIDVWERSRIKMGRWLQGQLLLCLFVFIIVFIALSLLRIPNALSLSLLAGIMEIIPMFGPVIAAIPSIIVGSISGGIKLGLIVALVYIVIQQIENQILVPLVMKKAVGIPSIMVILSLLVGARLGGFNGMLISVPLAAIVMELYSDLAKRREKMLKKKMLKKKNMSHNLQTYE